MEKTHKKQLDSLLTLQFQLFTEEEIQKSCEYPCAKPTLRGLSEASKSADISPIQGCREQNINSALQQVA